MIKTEILNVNGKPVEAVLIHSPGGEGQANMLVLKCRNGFIMCGYLNMEVASQFNDAAAIISGSSFEDILKNPVKAVSPKAEKLGVKAGMSGAEACDALNA